MLLSVQVLQQRLHVFAHIIFSFMNQLVHCLSIYPMLTALRCPHRFFLYVYTMSVCGCVHKPVSVSYSALCASVYMHQHLCQQVCVNLPLTRWQVRCCAMPPGALKLAQQAQTEPTVPQTIHYYALLCTCVMFSCWQRCAFLFVG